MQSHSDRLEQRLEALEMRKEPASPRPATAEASANGDRPRLLVVKLEPGEEGRDAPATEAPTATLRPEDS